MFSSLWTCSVPSVEVLGKGEFGMMYVAIMENGVAVAASRSSSAPCSTRWCRASAPATSARTKTPHRLLLRLINLSILLARRVQACPEFFFAAPTRQRRASVLDASKSIWAPKVAHAVEGVRPSTALQKDGAQFSSGIDDRCLHAVRPVLASKFQGIGAGTCSDSQFQLPIKYTYYQR
jgi:hypothetical protein